MEIFHKFSNMEAPKKSSSKISKKISTPDQPDLKTEKWVHLSNDYKGSFIELSQDLQTVTGYKGYRSVLANFPIIEGTYFFECKIEQSSSPNSFSNIAPQVRIGLSTTKLDCEISLGSDRLSYAYKSIDGCAIHDGIKRLYNEEYSEGDVIGCLIHMKPPKPKLRGDLVDKEKVEVNEGSKVVYYKNGKCLGVAFENLLEGFYHAGVSVYMSAQVSVNFGPEFEYPPQSEDLDDDTMDFKPYSVIATEPKLYTDLEF